MSLYQKYRPKDFSDLVGQTFIRRALTSALTQGKTVGAYLFCGSRGTGKTSVARILAKAINCTNLGENGNPCGKCDNCLAFASGSMLDIIEIDGASNNGVANVRDLIERARFQPTSGKFKIYIIDEVHMLSPGAFNALLKTLEEPPDHVKFILATTEFHKIPETIVSRTQRYDFKKHTESDIVDRLAYIAGQENIKTEVRALELIARLARGGLRDAISLFEQYAVGGEISFDFIEQNLSLVGPEFLEKLIRLILDEDIDGLRPVLDDLKQKSVEPRRFFEEFLYHLRESAYRHIRTPEFPKIWTLFEASSQAYGRLKEFPDGFLLLEMTLLGCLGRVNQTVNQSVNQTSRTSLSDKVDTPSSKVASPASKIESRVATAKEKPAPSEVQMENPAPTVEKPKTAEKAAPAEKTIPAEKTSPENQTSTKDFSFPELVAQVKATPKKAVLLAALKWGSFHMEMEPTPVFTLTSRSEFERKQLNNIETKEFLGSVILDLFGIRSEIRFVAGTAAGTATSAATSASARDNVSDSGRLASSGGVAKPSTSNTLEPEDISEIF